MPRSNVELNGFPIAEIYNYDGSFTANALYSGWIFIEQDRAYRENHKFDMKNSTVVKADIINSRVMFSFPLPIIKDPKFQ